MTPEAVSFWADIAAVFCLVQVIVVTIALGVGLAFGLKYLRKGRKALGIPLLMAQVYALRAQQITIKVTDRVASVPIGIHGVTTQVKTTAQTLLRGKSVS